MNKIMKTIIVIPARYGSTRLPGKPLIEIAGKTMLQRVVEIAQHAIKDQRSVDIVVATDDERIMQHTKTLDVNAVMTPVDCLTGTDRALAAVKQLDNLPDYVINLQGDVPIIPPHFITQLIDTLHSDSDAQIVTPIVQLAWQALEQLREFKQQTPFSGTTAIVDNNHYAKWFSKNIIPAIRNEKKLREANPLSPIFRHIGLYGYRFDALSRYVALSEGHYEALEGLEQLRALENGIPIKTVSVTYGDYPEMTGVDTIEDAKRVAALIKQYGEII